MQLTYMSIAAYMWGLSIDQLNTVFVGVIIFRLLYALPAWGVFYPRVNLDAFLKRSH